MWVWWWWWGGGIESGARPAGIGASVTDASKKWFHTRGSGIGSLREAVVRQQIGFFFQARLQRFW